MSFDESIDLEERLKRSVKWFILWVIVVFFAWPSGEPGEGSLAYATLVCVPFLFAVIRIAYDSASSLSEAFEYACTPDFVSYLFGEFWKDIASEVRLMAVFAAQAGAVSFVYWLYYK